MKKYLTLYNICIFAIFLVIIFLRLYKIGAWFSFNFDEEYQASLAWEQVKDFHPIWIGVSASNIGYYLGPGFTYLNALLFFISHGDPIILGIFSAILGLVTTISIFFITREFFSRQSALFAAAIYGGSMLINYFDRRFWNPSPIPFITVWMFYSLVKAQKNSRWFIISTILMASAYHVHLSLFIFWPVLIYLVIQNFKKIHWTTWVLMIASYLIITSPLLIFDLNHNFDNLRAPLRFFQKNKAEQSAAAISLYSIKSHLTVFLSSLGRLWFIKPFTNIQEEQCLGTHCRITAGNSILILFSILTILWNIQKSIKNNTVGLLLIIMGLNVLSFSLYPGYSAEYYLLGFLALFPISIGLFLNSLPVKLSMAIVVLFLLANTYTILTTTQEQYGLQTRKKFIQTIMTTIKDKPYSLETYGRTTIKYHHYGGWRFLFKIYGRTPTQSFADESFGWIYQNELTGDKPYYKVIVAEEVDKKFPIQPIQKIKEGPYYGYVFKEN